MFVLYALIKSFLSSFIKLFIESLVLNKGGNLFHIFDTCTFNNLRPQWVVLAIGVGTFY